MNEDRHGDRYEDKNEDKEQCSEQSREHSPENADTINEVGVAKQKETKSVTQQTKQASSTGKTLSKESLSPVEKLLQRDGWMDLGPMKDVVVRVSELPRK